MTLTQSVLKEHLSYDPETGVFTWLKPTSKRVRVGDIAGYADLTGESKKTYIRIVINGNKYYAHRLAFLFMTNSIPDVIDHENNNGLDNRWSNLRDCTSSQNACNRKLQVNNTTGVKGVTIENHKYRARVSLDGVRYTVGLFDTIEKAKTEIEVFRNKLHGVFSNDG